VNKIWNGESGFFVTDVHICCCFPSNMKSHFYDHSRLFGRQNEASGQAIKNLLVDSKENSSETLPFV
jgi:hypothetical protein